MTPADQEPPRKQLLIPHAPTPISNYPDRLLGQETIADYLQNWQLAQAAKLKHLQFQLTAAQLEVVEEALTELLPQAKESQGESPNTRGTALYLLCQRYLKEKTP